MALTVVFDLDGTLLDSDAALVAPFLALGVAESDITFGHPIEEFCTGLGISIDEYLDLYDTDAAQPFEGISAMLELLGAFSICSNKHPRYGWAELDRLGWEPVCARFSSDFGGGPKRLGPMLESLEVEGGDVLFVGDTLHDQRCASDVGAQFAWAGWNPRTAASGPSGVVLRRAVDLLDLLD
jgi:phosphoglycolate phosphatase-like HAD superfamily hydrolase